jgi:hypothetical protein
MSLTTFKLSFVDITVFENNLTLTTSETFLNLSFIYFICDLIKIVDWIFDKGLPMPWHSMLDVSGNLKHFVVTASPMISSF